jgi:hypothetical protein
MHQCILSILKHHNILIIWNHRCVKCAVIYIVFKIYDGHVINMHHFLKYDNNTGASKNLNSLRCLII